VDSGRCPYQKSGTCSRRCRCGSRLIPSAGACPRCSSPCSPPSGPSLGRVSSSRRRSSRSGINSPSSNARRQRDPGLVAPIAGCGYCCLGCGQTGEAPSRSSRPTPSCAGIVAASASTGCGSHDRDGRAAASGCRHPGADPADANRQPLWRAPRIHGKLQKLGLTLSETTVAKYLGRRRPPPSPTWRPFPRQPHRATRLGGLLHRPDRHVSGAVRVPGLVARPPAHRPLQRHHPSDRGVDRTTAPRGVAVGHRAAMPRPRPRCDLQPGTSACRASHGHQRRADGASCPLAEPMRGTRDRSLRRECLDHVIVWNERSLRHHIQQYLAYYHERRTHLSLKRMHPSRGQASHDRRRDRPGPAPRRPASSLRASRRLIDTLGGAASFPPAASSAVVFTPSQRPSPRGHSALSPLPGATTWRSGSHASSRYIHADRVFGRDRRYEAADGKGGGACPVRAFRPLK
jgi:hypothetical protein